MALTLPLPRWPACEPGRFCAGELLASRRTWIAVNRILAWAIVVAPLAQIALGTRHRHGLMADLLFDLALVILHGALSLVLFGLPSAPRGNRWMLWLGLRPAGMGPRSNFLMTAWRIALPLMSAPLFAVPGGWLVALPPAWLWLVMPFTTISHISNACGYAMRRWGASAGLTHFGEALLPVLYIWASLAHLVI